jgi:hypothetical protein
MKWSWKSFGLLFISAFVLGIGLAYVISMIIDAKRGPGAPDSTLVSMKFGGLLAPTILAAVSGWMAWSLKPLLVAGVIVSTIYSGNLGIGMLTVFLAAIVYVVARNARVLTFYYFPSETGKSEP